MKKEKWNIYKLTKKDPNILYLKELKDSDDGLTINLTTDCDIAFCIVKFDGYLSYRVTDEGDLQKTLHEMENSECLGKSPFYTVENSLYLEWFCEQCYNIHAKNTISHYLIATPNEVVDILYQGKPEIILCESKT